MRDLLFIVFFVLFNTISSSNVCPLFRCSPDIIALDYSSINSTLDIKCIFLNRIEDPSDVLWKFSLNHVERIINDLDGGILPPFKHIIRAANLSNLASPPYPPVVVPYSASSSSLPNQHHHHHNIHHHSIGSQSVLRILLLNSSYFTNYTIMHTRDSCQQTIRVNLKETAMGYASSSILTPNLVVPLLAVISTLFHHL